MSPGHCVRNQTLLPEAGRYRLRPGNLSRRQILFAGAGSSGRARLCPGAKTGCRASKGRERRMNLVSILAIWAAAPATGAGRRLIHAAANSVVYSAALPAHDSPAAKEAETVAADACPASRPATASQPPAAFAASSSPSRTIRIVIRVAPDNLKLEVAKSAIASVTTQEGSLASRLLASGLVK